MVGTTVSHYRVTGELGKGGMGIVYEAEDKNLPRRVALKFCSAAQDPQLRAGLLSEARALCSLKHPNIAEVYELGQTGNGEPFIAMELLPGALTGELRRGKLGVRESVRTATAVAKALEHAHSRGIVHRDIKPSNVRMTEAGQLKVTDFGIAATILQAAAARPAGGGTTTVTLEHVRRGTPGFMAPEVVRGERADRRSDLFALGCVLYECLTGKEPFLGQSAADVEANVLHKDPPPPSSLNPVVWPALDRITLKLLEKRPENRYQSAGEVVAALDAIEALERPRLLPRYRAWAVYLAVALILCVAIVTWYVRRGHRVPADAMDWYKKGLAALEDGTYYKAALQLQTVLKIDPGFAMAHAHLAEAWDELDFANKARDELLLAEPGPGMTGDDALHLKAIKATVTGDLGTAAAAYQQLAKHVTGHDRAEAFLDLGRVYDRAEKREEAAAAYTQAARADSQSGAPFLRLASVYVTERDAPKANQALDTAAELYRRSSNGEGVAECLYQRARLETKAPESLKILDKALEQARLYQNEQQQIKIQLLEADRYLSSGQREEALKTANQALEQAREAGLESMATRGLIDVGRAMLGKGDTENAEKYLAAALSMARRSESRRSEARAEANLAGMFYYLGQPDRALPYAQQALAFYRPGGYRSETVRMLLVVGGINQSRGDYDIALKSLQEAYDRLPKDKPSADLAQVEEFLADLYLTRENFAEARSWYLKSRDAAAAVRKHDILAAVSANLAEIAAWQGHERDAATLLRDGLAAVAGTNQEYLQRAGGIIALALGKYGVAVRELQNSLEPGKVDEADVKCSLTTWLGLALLRSGRTREGQEVLTKAVDMAEAQRDPEIKTRAALGSAEALIAGGRRAEAVPVLQRTLPYLDRWEIQESAWRAWALLAKAEPAAEAGKAAAKARDIYNRLMATWDNSDVRSYSSRPDIRKLLNAVNAISKG